MVSLQGNIKYQMLGIRKTCGHQPQPTSPRVDSMTGHYVLMAVLWNGRNIHTSIGDAFFPGWDPAFSEGRVSQIGFHEWRMAKSVLLLSRICSEAWVPLQIWVLVCVST